MIFAKQWVSLELLRSYFFVGVCVCSSPWVSGSFVMFAAHTPMFNPDHGIAQNH